MTDRDKNRGLGLEDFLRYARDQMGNRERNDFEKLLQQDPFAAEALEGLSSLAPEEARADLARLKERLQSRISGRKADIRNNRTILYRVAATVAVLLVVTSVLYMIFNNRMGQLERKVAESPVTEQEKAVPASPSDVDQGKSLDNVNPVQPVKEEKGKGITEREKTVPSETRERKTAAVLAEPEVTATGKKVSPVETAAGTTRTKTLEEKPAGQELADEAAVKETDIVAAPMAFNKEADVAGVAAPAAAMESEPAARSRKREAAMPLQKAASEGRAFRTITGQVISAEDQRPLPGAVVAFRGSDTGTVTDMNGRFEISAKDDADDALITRFIGMEPKEIQVEGDTALIIPMTSDARYLDQAVLIERGPGTSTQPAGSTAVALAKDDASRDKTAYREAMPAGGKVKFDEYIKENLRFPEKGKNLTRAAVILSFIVGTDGRPSQVSVLMSPGKDFSEEAKRLLVNGPDWEPALSNGKNIEQPTRMRILFTKD